LETCDLGLSVVQCFKIINKTQQFGDRLNVCPEVKMVEGSTYRAGPRGKAVLSLWLIRYSPKPFLSA
jgi:hypothetical protein